MVKTKASLVAFAVTGLFALAGCTQEARQDFDKAGERIASGTEKSVDRAEQVVKAGTREAGEDLQEMGRTIEETAGPAVQKAGKEAKDAGQTISWTAKVKNALFADAQIKARNLNVDSSGEHDAVVITGVVRTEAEKARVTQLAKNAVAGKAKIDNRVQVAAAAK